MKKLTTYGLVAAVLVVGLLLGYGGPRLFGLAGTNRIRNASVEVGDQAPDFRLPDHAGGYVKLSDFEGESNVVIAFYPLAWTPV